jgi:hypothetical protein
VRCLRIYATPDGASRFGEVDIAMTTSPLFPNEAPFELSAYFPRHAFASFTFQQVFAKPVGTPRPEEYSRFGSTVLSSSRRAMERYGTFRLAALCW